MKGDLVSCWVKTASDQDNHLLAKSSSCSRPHVEKMWSPQGFWEGVQGSGLSMRLQDFLTGTISILEKNSVYVFSAVEKHWNGVCVFIKHICQKKKKKRRLSWQSVSPPAHGSSRLWTSIHECRSTSGPWATWRCQSQVALGQHESLAPRPRWKHWLTPETKKYAPHPQARLLYLFPPEMFSQLRRCTFPFQKNVTVSAERSAFCTLSVET